MFRKNAGFVQGADLFSASGRQPKALAGVPHRLVAQQRDAQLGRHLSAEQKAIKGAQFSPALTMYCLQVLRCQCTACTSSQPVEA